jgi:hypothetical protein
MFEMSFRRCVSRFVPGEHRRKRAALVVAALALAGCGGGSGASSERLVRGHDYRFSAPTGWAEKRTPRGVQVADGITLLSVTRYPLVHAYRPTLWPRVVPELDRAAAGVAQQQKGRVAASRTTSVAGLRARSYDIEYEREGKQLVERITFVLRSKTEYYLLCRYERGGDTGACDRLLATFTLD